MSASRRTRLRRPTLASRFLEALRQLAVAALVLIAVGAAGWLYLMSRLDGEIRRAIESRVSEHLVGTPLAVGETLSRFRLVRQATSPATAASSGASA